MRTPQKAKWALLVHDLELQSSAFLEVRIGAGRIFSVKKKFLEEKAPPSFIFETEGCARRLMHISVSRLGSNSIDV